MKKMRLISLMLSLLVFIGTFSFSALAAQTGSDSNITQSDSNASVVNGTHSIDATQSILGQDQLVANAEAVFLYETSTQTLMYAWNPDARLFPASLVKIMTALIAAENGELTDVVTVKADVLATVPYDAMSANLQADEMISLEDLLYCMMVGSANDAAAVIADHIAGSQEQFVQQMNRYASKLGCTGTQFTNVHGLHDESQYTTARDMARILNVAMENDVFRAVFAASSYTIPATNKSETRELSTSNILMSDDRVTGGRTGVTEEGTRCLAASAEENDLKLISIVMGSKSIYAEDGYTEQIYGGFDETAALYDIAFDGYKATQILFDGQALIQYDVLNGSNRVTLGPKTSVSVILPESTTLSDLSFRYFDVIEKISAPIEKGRKVSYVEVWHGSTCVAQADLFTMNAVSIAQTQHSQDRISNENNMWPRLGIIIALIAAGVLVLIFIARIYKKVRSAAQRSHSRRYRRGRRRSR